MCLVYGVLASQYVRSQVDKWAEAHSRVGMPVQSRGHLNSQFNSAELANLLSDLHDIGDD